MRNVAVFGSTGAIGQRTLEVVNRLKNEFRITALVANQDVQGLVRQAKRWKPKTAVLVNETKLDELQKALRHTGVRAAAGTAALNEVASRGRVQEDLSQSSE